MTFEEFKKQENLIQLKHIHLREEELDQLCREYEKDLPFKQGDRIKFHRPSGELQGVVEDIKAHTIPKPSVSVKLKGRKPYYDVHPGLVAIIEKADGQTQQTTKRLNKTHTK